MVSCDLELLNEDFLFQFAAGGNQANNILGAVWWPPHPHPTESSPR